MPEENAVNQTQPDKVIAKESEIEALAKEIAAKYGLRNLNWQVREIVAVYDFTRQTVDADNVPLVFSVMAQHFFKGH